MNFVRLVLDSSSRLALFLPRTYTSLKTPSIVFVLILLPRFLILALNSEALLALPASLPGYTALKILLMRFAAAFSVGVGSLSIACVTSAWGTPASLATVATAPSNLRLNSVLLAIMELTFLPSASSCALLP